MTIITCAIVEQRWMANLTAEKTLFRAARFMDDILMVYAAHAGWDHSGLVRRLTASECYSAPLTLVHAKEDIFFETTFEVKENRFRHWLKDDNTTERPHTIWRYQHFASATPFQQKRAVIMACMKKIQRIGWRATRKRFTTAQCKSSQSLDALNTRSVFYEEYVRTWPQRPQSTSGSTFERRFYVDVNEYLQERKFLGTFAR